MSVEYEVIWDGSHGGADRDLLLGLWPQATVTAKATSSLPELERKEHAFHRTPETIAAELETVFACIAREPCSRWQMRQMTGLSEQSVSVALNRLKKERRIVQAHYGTWRAR